MDDCKTVVMELLNRFITVGTEQVHLSDEYREAIAEAIAESEWTLVKQESGGSDTVSEDQQSVTDYIHGFIAGYNVRGMQASEAERNGGGYFASVGDTEKEMRGCLKMYALNRPKLSRDKHELAYSRDVIFERIYENAKDKTWPDLRAMP